MSDHRHVYVHLSRPFNYSFLAVALLLWPALAGCGADPRGRFRIDNAYGRTGKIPLLGGGILSRFNMVFDYSRRLLILEPNRRFSEPYLYDASGIVLRLTEDLKHFRIHAVLASSPASEADLRRDDTITAINGREAAHYDLTELQTLFKQKGAHHRLDIRRGRQRLQVAITLRELL